MSIHVIPRRINGAVMLTIGLFSNAVFAQNKLEEVIVSAQKRSESLQDVPITLQAFFQQSS